MTTTQMMPNAAEVLVEQRPAWLDENVYPFESRYIELGGNRVHYVDEGTGPVLLFLHGQPAWSFLYRNIIKDLRADFRCIALDIQVLASQLPSMDSVTRSLIMQRSWSSSC